MIKYGENEGEKKKNVETLSLLEKKNKFLRKREGGGRINSLKIYSSAELQTLKI